MYARHAAFVPKALQPVAHALSREEKRRRKKWKRRREQDKPLGAKVKRKYLFRIKARNPRGRLVFFSIRTKKPTMNIKRILARADLQPIRIER